jgi:MOSC domain-containing protein YiiM
MQDFRFAAAFRAAEKPGFYCRVITPGNVGAGDAVRIETYAGESISVLEMFREHYRRNKTEADLHRLLRAPISVRARHSLQSELDQALSANGA